ncbi:MAG: hypothetical protein ACUVV5_11760 [Candidatus Aminicenantales bacterium]
MEGTKIKKVRIGLTVIFIFGAWLEPGLGLSVQPRRFKAVEIRIENSDARKSYFFRPGAFIFRAPNLWGLESDDSEIRVYGGAGNFLHAFGRKGHGPGEFDLPLDLDVLGERVYVADGGNRRVEILDRKGTSLGGFKVGFFPRRIVALDEDHVVVAHLPSKRDGEEKMLHCFSARGKLLWEGYDSYFSGDGVFDTLRNDIFLRRGERGEFFVFGRSEERRIFKFNRNGERLGRIQVSDDYPLRKVVIPTGEKGKKKEISAFCWNGDWHEGKFYLIVPEFTEHRDVGPGKEVAVIDEEGWVEGFIHFPLGISWLSVWSSGRKIFVLDGEGELRLFEVVAR